MTIQMVVMLKIRICGDDVGVDVTGGSGGHGGNFYLDRYDKTYDFDSIYIYHHENHLQQQQQ